MEAMQAAILLMPDPNREALQTLLLFLNEVAANSERNQVNTRNEKEKLTQNRKTTELLFLSRCGKLHFIWLPDKGVSVKCRKQSSNYFHFGFAFSTV